jgi:uncharacterized peroxidase-related enzyme
MRLEILSRGHTWPRKLQLRIMRILSGKEAPDVIKLILYRNEFFGGPYLRAVQYALRGPSEWTVTERELIAAVVSQANECPFCVRSHGAVVDRLAGPGLLAAVLSDLDEAPLPEGLRATLKLVVKATRDPGAATREDVRAVLASGVSRAALQDALHIALLFNVINRLANAFDFEIPSERAFAADARMLATIGYRL